MGEGEGAGARRKNPRGGGSSGVDADRLDPGARQLQRNSGEALGGGAMSAPHSLGLALFTALCEVGNLLEAWRDIYVPGSDDWTAGTEILGALDACIDMLVTSQGLGGLDDDA